MTADTTADTASAPGRESPDSAGPGTAESTGPGTAESTGREVPDFEVPDGGPTAECPYCGRPFASRRLWALHLGERHPEECTDAERDAVEEAIDEELDDLFVFHIEVVAALTLLYAVLVLVYMVVLGWG